MTDNPHNLPLPRFARTAIRKALLVPYRFLTPYLDAPVPFPDNRALVHSHSYNFEDMLLNSILGCKKNGRYIDIGANDPSFRNNTKMFYDKGWSGINVEPCVQKFKEICESRPRDLNLNIALSDANATVPFYVLDWEMASCLDKDVAISRCKEYKTFIKEIVPIRTMRFDTLMEMHCGDSPVDFVSIDVETHELRILATNNWEKYRPKLFCIEICYDNAEETTAFMESKDYCPLFNTEENGIYIDERLEV